ncbi:hypothetical protein NL676_038764 [Syzygium grande]|nr:hypothetical protein NL676_038764 [Syzygium grande]
MGLNNRCPHVSEKCHPALAGHSREPGQELASPHVMAAPSLATTAPGWGDPRGRRFSRTLWWRRHHSTRDASPS